MMTSPSFSSIILSIPRGPSEVRTASATAAPNISTTHNGEVGPRHHNSRATHHWPKKHHPLKEKTLKGGNTNDLRRATATMIGAATYLFRLWYAMSVIERSRKSPTQATKHDSVSHRFTRHGHIHHSTRAGTQRTNDVGGPDILALLASVVALTATSASTSTRTSTSTRAHLEQSNALPTCEAATQEAHACGRCEMGTGTNEGVLTNTGAGNRPTANHTL